MLNSHQFVFWLVLCCIITGRASSGDGSANSPSPGSPPESGNEGSKADRKPEYDPGTSSLELYEGYGRRRLRWYVGGRADAAIGPGR
uniref:Putative secreted protein n=1 Tax=Ixodes ricinus TaxID=34613 RepID=V5HAB6_IXORI